MKVAYDTHNTGVLFVNDKKDTERHPDWQGHINVAGVDYWISAWNKQSRAGNEFISLAVREKQPRGKPQPQAPESTTDSPNSVNPDFDDEIPF